MERSRSPTRIMVCRMRMLCPLQVGNVPGLVAQFETQAAPVRAKLLDHRPEARAMVHFLEMSQLVADNVVDHRQRHEDQPPVERDAAMMAATPPARAGRRQAQR